MSVENLSGSKLAALQSDSVERWLAYLRSLPMRSLATENVAAATERLWSQLSDELDALIPPPNASPTDDGGVLMSWQRNGRHLEVEMMPDGTYDWFYRHRASDTDESGTDAADEVSDRFALRLREVIL
ncbi:MAG: hypothetical protein ACRD3J_21410 [Thermoanaerobaculia bacterium]